jgi:hypothetical protein
MAEILPDWESVFFRTENPKIDPRRLDREADALLQWGYRRRAEMLSRQAQDLREGGA